MTALSFGPRRRSRKPSLTPMIDVVFLLLVFFMLAARFGSEGALDLTLAAPVPAAADWTGPPRLVDVAPDALRLNGVPVATTALADALSALMRDDTDMVILRPVAGAGTGDLVAVMALLRDAGLARIAVVEQ